MRSQKQLVALRQHIAELKTAKAQRKQAEGVLRKSAEEIEDLYDKAPCGYHSLDKNGVFVRINETELAWLGYTRKEIIGKKFPEIITPESRKTFQATFPILRKRGWVKDLELELVRKDGSVMPVLISASAILDEKGDFLMSRSTVYDVTERKQAEKALRESRELYWALFNGCSQGILMADIETHRFLYANPAICRMLGYTEAELLQLRVADIHPAEALAQVEADFVAMVRGKKISSEAIPCRRKDGTVLFADITAARLQVAGREDVVVGFFNDVTERKETERALRESEEKFRLLAEQSPNMIFINQRERIVYANAKCEELIGYPKEQFYSSGFNFLSFVAPDCVKAVQHAFGKHQKDEEVPPYECGLVTKEGRRIETIITTKLVQYDGESAVLGIVTEITERKRIEEAREQSVSLLRATLESTADGILVVNREGKIVGFNERFTQLWHIPETIIASRSDQQTLAFVLEQLKDPEGFLAKVHQLYSQPEAENFDVLKFKDGRVFERYSIPQRIEGRPVGRVWSFRDVTERKQVEESLRLEKEQLERAFRAGNIALWEWDMATGRLEWSNTVDSMLGYEPGTFPRTLQKWEEIVHPDDREWELQVLAKHLEKGTPYDVEYRVKRKDGSYIWWHDMGACRRDEQGKAYQMSGVCIDITARKLAEDAKRKSEERLERINHCLLELGTDHNSNVNRLTALCGELLGATCALYNRLQDGLLCSVSQWQLPPGFKLEDPPTDGNICYDIINSGSDDATIITDLPNTPYGKADPNVQAYGFRAYMGCAVKCEGKPVGSLCVVYQTDYQPTNDDRRILGIIASAIGNEDTRGQAQEALRESEERYRLLFEGITDGVFVHETTDDDMPGQFLALNDTICQRLGYTREELLHMTVRDIDAPESTIDPRAIMGRLKRDKKVLFQQMHVTKNGHRIPVEINAQIFQMQDHTVILSVIRDITERKEMEEYAVKLSSLKHQLLGPGSIEEKFKLITDGMVEIFGADFARIWLTKKADLCEEGCQHAAATEGLNICRNRTRCLHLVASSGRYTQIDGSHRRVPFGCYKIGRVASGEDAGFITNDVTNDPRVHDHEWAKSLGLVSFAGFRLVSTDRKPVGVLALFSKRAISPDIEHLLEDLANATSQVIITEIAEEERRKLEAQVQQSQRLESLGVLAGGIAHDFNNLLTSIVGNVGLAQADLPVESPVQESLKEIENASHSAAELCRQMLAYSGRGRFIMEQLNLSRLTQELIHLLQASISKKAMLNCKFADNLPAIEADPSQVRQVVMNLVINASEAIGDKEGIITISTGTVECDQNYLRENHFLEPPPPGTYVFLEVLDTGCGMDAETQAKIFDPFFTTKFTGRGLGLAAVLGIMRQHKGAIKVASEPSEGTTFMVLFPVSTKPASQPQPDAAPESWHGSGAIMVVDDEAAVRNVTRIILERSGFTVLTAADGREAIKLFQKHGGKIVCVLLDLTMPHMDGEETYRELRRIRSDVPVILASGYSEQEIAKHFTESRPAGIHRKTL